MMKHVCRNTRREIDESESHQALSEDAALHLAGCTDCRQFREERIQLRDLVGSLEPVTAPADFDFRLRARIAQSNEARRPMFNGFRLSVPVTVAAATLMMILGSIVWKHQQLQTPSPNAATIQQSNDKAAAPTVTVDQGVAVTASLNEPDTRSSDKVAQNTRGGRKPAGLVKPRAGSSVDMAATAANSFRRDGPGTVSLSAPLKPMVVSMEDDQGATRTISLPPVSFGSQRLVDNRIPPPASNRVW